MNKQDLLEYSALQKDLSLYEKRIFKLTLEIQSPKTSFYSELPKGGTPASMEDKIVKLMELKEQMTITWDKKIDKKIEIENAIETLVDPYQKEIIYYRYIQGLKWKEIEKKVNYETTQMYKIHRKALINLQKKNPLNE